METLFAPAERDSREDVASSFEDLKSQVPYDAVLDLVPNMSLIVNERRQVLFANAALLSTFALEARDIVGARSGEILGCVHAAETAGGCGTAEACRVCGAVGAILEAIASRRQTARECRVMRANGGRPDCLDLLVTAAPIAAAGNRFILVTLLDISDSKRREVLERLFFHDLMNGLSSLHSGIVLINAEYGALRSEHDYLARTTAAMDRLIDEVAQQREILTMEKGDLEVELIEFDLSGLAMDLIRHIELADYARGKFIAFRDRRSEPTACSDPILLRRVIVNMLKNALEASEVGEEVGLELGDEGSRAVISVRNPAYIPRDAQLQLFHRSFSTKGQGRGLGTYSMKMLTEEYLGGSIGFSSEQGKGTIFWAKLPGRAIKT
jgi:signal transduction histidine kinase